MPAGHAEGRRPLRHARVVRLHRRRTGVPGRRAVTPAAGGSPDIDEAVERLRAGGLVAFPTETVYGLGADATQRGRRGAGLRRQGPAPRPSAHRAPAPTPVPLDEWAATVPATARRLAAAHWPGPLTLLVDALRRVPDVVTGGRPTVGLRVPAHPLALRLLRAFGGGAGGAVGQPVRQGEPDDGGPRPGRSRRRRRPRARRRAVRRRGRVDHRRLHHRPADGAAPRRRHDRGAVGHRSAGPSPKGRRARAGRRACWSRTTRRAAAVELVRDGEAAAARAAELRRPGAGRRRPRPGPRRRGLRPAPVRVAAGGRRPRPRRARRRPAARRPASAPPSTSACARQRRRVDAAPR